MSIIAPVKGEKDNFKWMIEKIGKHVSMNYEILVVYDSDVDNTLPVAKKLAEKYRHIKLVKNTKGKGVSNAILMGFEKAKGNVLVMMAFDRTDDPKAIEKMYKELYKGYDIVCPTRYSKGGKVIGKKSIQSTLSMLAGVTTPYVLGIPTSDLTYSYKMFKKEILNEVTIESTGGFEFAEELLVKAYHKGYKLTEVPIIWRDRQYGKSKFKLLEWLPRYTYWYLWAVGMRFKRLLVK